MAELCGMRIAGSDAHLVPLDPHRFATFVVQFLPGQDAATGRDGLDSALAQTPDLILLDIVMPSLDGYQVCQLLRENESTRPMMTKAVARMLKPSGHLVSVAGSGEEALEKLTGQPFDVVISDVGMGTGMNGWELAEAVKYRWPGLRFLLATGWGAALDPGQAKTRGVEAVLSKPYQLADLLHALAPTDQAA
jgi:two-component system cell cycle response regulator CpdR